MMYEAMVSLEVAKLLKEVGFDYPCNRYYDTNTEDGDAEATLSLWSAGVEIPNSKLLDTEFACCTQTIARQFLREEMHLYVEIRFTNISIFPSLTIPRYYGVVWNLENGQWFYETTLETNHTAGFVEHDDAVNFTLLKLLQKILKNKKEK